VNLDHVATAEAWGPRYDQVTPRFYDQSGTSGRVRAKNRGAHTLEAHLDALTAAGLVEADTPWRLLSTVLLLARRPT
jgi:hypothetical protein